jgi:hypothetical protein
MSVTLPLANTTRLRIFVGLYTGDEITMSGVNPDDTVLPSPADLQDTVRSHRALHTLPTPEPVDAR